MTTEELGPWQPLTVARATELFSTASFRWWVAGGHALEAHLSAGRAPQSWRPHDDTDIGLCRHDAPELFSVLRGWDIHTASDGVLTPWSGEPLSSSGSDQGITNLWCRPSPTAPWALDVLIGEGTDQQWIYRPDRSIRRPWTDAVLHTAEGLPYLAPEIQLLFKSRTIRPKDAVDAAHVIPLLEAHRRSWLVAHLPRDHPWQTIEAATER